MTYTLLPKMLKKKKGNIIIVSSAASNVKGAPNRFIYGTTKGALNGFVKALAADYVKDGIRCNAILPGTVETPSWTGRVNMAKDPKQARLPRTLRHFQIDTIVRFTDRPNSDNTVLEVIAQDRPGLLHQVAKAFLQCKIHLVSAKVSTFGERAEDIFYITDRDGHCVDKSASRDQISRQIRSALPS